MQPAQPPLGRGPVGCPRLGSWHSYNDSFYIVKPYNLQQSDRFRIVGGREYQTWVCSNDKPFAEGSPTAPRTEIAWENTYTSGQRMWEADVYIVAGTAGSNIMQIFHAERPDDDAVATDIRIRVYNDHGGRLKAKDGEQEIATGVYDHWFNLKVAHNTVTHQIKIYIDDRLMVTVPDSGSHSSSQQHQFKNGVYGSDGGVANGSNCPAAGRAEAHFRYFKFWTRPA